MDDVITLIAESITGYDDTGNAILVTRERELLCQIFGVTRSEFYSAAAAGLQPEVTVRLSDFADYEGEKLARWNGELYTVIRTYRDAGSFQRGNGLAPNGIELTLERRIGDKEVDESGS